MTTSKHLLGCNLLSLLLASTLFLAYTEAWTMSPEKIEDVEGKYVRIVNPWTGGELYAEVPTVHSRSDAEGDMFRLFKPYPKQNKYRLDWKVVFHLTKDPSNQNDDAMINFGGVQSTLSYWTVKDGKAETALPHSYRIILEDPAGGPDKCLEASRDPEDPVRVTEGGCLRDTGLWQFTLESCHPGRKRCRTEGICVNEKQSTDTSCHEFGDSDICCNGSCVESGCGNVSNCEPGQVCHQDGYCH